LVGGLVGVVRYRFGSIVLVGLVVGCCGVILVVCGLGGSVGGVWWGMMWWGGGPVVGFGS